MRVVGWRAGAGAACLVVVVVLALHSPHPAHHWMGFTEREARLVERVREAEHHGRWLRLQLTLRCGRSFLNIMVFCQPNLSQERASKAGVRRPPAPGCPPAAESCEEVHVAIVCAGINASRAVVTLVKSILFHRRHPVTFHFISDPAARRTLAHLAATWRLPATTWRFYSAEQVQARPPDHLTT